MIGLDFDDMKLASFAQVVAKIWTGSIPTNKEDILAGLMLAI